MTYARGVDVPLVEQASREWYAVRVEYEGATCQAVYVLELSLIILLLGCLSRPLFYFSQFLRQFHPLQNPSPSY